LADALASLEYYLEALREQRANRDEILDITCNSLEAHGDWPLPEPVAPAVVETVAAPAEAFAVPAQGQAAEEEIPAEDGATAEAATPATAGLAPAQKEAAAGSVPTEAPAATPAPAVPAQATATAVAGGFDNTGDAIDDEIREVFLEVFAEELDYLDRLLPPWHAQPDDMERLLPIRRVFQT